MSEEFLTIGTVTGVTGLNGGLRIQCITDFPGRFSEGRRVFIEIRSFKKEYTVRSFSMSGKKKGLLFLSAIDSREQAMRLNGCSILVPETEAREFASELDEDEFLHCDILSCTVFRNGVEFGNVVELFEAGGGTILAVSNGTHEYQIPFVKEMVDTSRVEDGIITIDPVEGLLDH